MIEDYVTEFFQEKIIQIKQNLVDAGRNASGVTLQEIQLQVALTEKVIDIRILMPSHYLFLDEGVAGTEGGRANTGRFSFKPTLPSPNMVKGMLQFMRNRGIVGDKYQTAKGIKNKALRRQTQEKALEGVAFAIARHIKKVGLERTDFYSREINLDVLSKFENTLLNEYSKELIISIGD